MQGFCRASERSCGALEAASMVSPNLIVHGLHGGLYLDLPNLENQLSSRVTQRACSLAVPRMLRCNFL